MSNTTLRNIDLYVPNFDYTLLLKLESMTPDQKDLLPSELAFKIFKKKEACVDNLSWTEKLYILSVCFKQDILIVTEDSESGIGPKGFKLAIDAQKGEHKNSEVLDMAGVHGLFIQGDKELMRSLLYLNHVQCSEIFNLFKMAHPREKSKKEAKFDGYHRAFSGVLRMLTTYESNKKKIIMQFGISVSKLLALMHFFEGEKKGNEFYNVVFKHSYTSNRGDLAHALVELYKDGFLDRRGTKNTYKYSITSKGIELLTRIINKLIYNV